MSNLSTMFKSVKVILLSWKLAMFIYLALAVLFTALSVFDAMNIVTEFGGRIHMGITFPSLIFVFILGITGFAEEFRLVASFNVSRRIYFFAQSLALLILGTSLAIVDLGFAALLTEASGIRFRHFLEEIEVVPAYTANLVVITVSLNIALAFIGWLIRLLYYRANKLQTILLSISPAVLFLFFVIFENRLSLTLYRGLLNVMERLHCQTGNVLSTTMLILLASLFTACMCYLLIKRTPIR